MRNGTGERGFEEMVFGTIERDWKARLYGPEETPWLAFLLRFALPEEREPANRFREIPAALTGSGYGEELWTHIAIDEAQDLSAPEAALLTSFVDPQGAITLSADFRQIVLPVHGIVDDEGIDCFRFGSSLRDPRDHSLFPFARNMRQSKQIGRFLQSFYEAAFGERPTFEPSETINDTKPELRIAEWERYAEIIRQRINVLKRSPLVRSVAVVQINEDEEEMRRLRDRLTKVGLELAEVWSPIAVPDRLVTTSVERCKGMEYDACFVLGLEAVERASLNFAKNRAYVALSRPARRLVILCDQFAPILRRVDPALFEVWNV
jgi:superfamily I DNA/RNA helicase